MLGFFKHLSPEKIKTLRGVLKKLTTLSEIVMGAQLGFDDQLRWSLTIALVSGHTSWCERIISFFFIFLGFVKIGPRS